MKVKDQSAIVAAHTDTSELHLWLHLLWANIGSATYGVKQQTIIIFVELDIWALNKDQSEQNHASAEDTMACFAVDSPKSLLWRVLGLPRRVWEWT